MNGSGFRLGLYAEVINDGATTQTINTDTGTLPGSTITSISEKGIHVQTGDGILLLTEVQSPGRKRVPAADFAKSRTLEHIELGL